MGRAAATGVLQRFHGGLPGEDVHHHQAVLRLPPRVLAEVGEVPAGSAPQRPTCPARAAGTASVEVVGQVPQKGARSRFPGCRRGLKTPGSLDAGRPAHTATCSLAPAAPARPPRPAGPGSPCHRAAPVKFFHFVPAKLFEAKPSLRSMSGRLCCLLHGVEELLELRHVGLRNLRLHPADHVARVACNHQAAGVPLVRGQGQLRQEALRLHQRLVVDHDELALVRPAVPLQEDPRALVAQQPQLRAAVGGRAVVGHLQLAPARPVLRQEEIVREVGGVGHGERVGGEELRRRDLARALVTSPHTTLPVDTPSLVAVKVQSRLSQSSGPVEAAPLMVRGARERPGGCEACRRRCARGRQCPRGHVARRGEVPGVGRVVDGECAAGFRWRSPRWPRR